MNADSLQAYCCGNCFKDLKESKKLTLLEHQAFCECQEIRIGVAKGTPCYFCKRSACPMHMDYVSVGSVQQ